MIVDGPLTVEATTRAVAELLNADASGLWGRACDLEGDLIRRVLAAIADGHPHSARIAKAALRAFDV